MADVFLKVYPEYYKVTRGMKNSAMLVLYIFMLKITQRFQSYNTIEMNYDEAKRVYASQLLDAEELSKFTSSRYSEGIRELKARGILTLCKDTKNLYLYNKNLFNIG